MGLGIASLQTSQKKEPVVVPPPGPPFAATSADNGLSVDTVSGRIVLGNDAGNAAMPAQLLSLREIAFNGNFLQFIDTVVGGSSRHILDTNTQQITNLATTNQFQVSVGAGNAVMDLASNPVGQASIFNMVSNAGSISLITEGPTQITFADAVKSWAAQLLLGVLHIRDNSGAGNGLIIDPVANTVTSTGEVATAPPAGGAGNWKLGTVVAGAVVLDAANFVEIQIGGAQVKLLKAL